MSSIACPCDSRQVPSCRLLLVDDSPGHIRAARTALVPYADVRVARSVRTARSLLALEPFDGLVISASLGTATTEVMDLITEGRARDLTTLVVGHAVRATEEDAFSWVGAMRSGRPLLPAAAAEYVVRAAGTEVPHGTADTVLVRVLHLLDELRERAGLTPTQTDVLVASVFGETRDDLRERLCVSDATLRKHVSATLAKASRAGIEAPNLDRLVSTLYVRAAMQSLDET